MELVKDRNVKEEIHSIEINSKPGDRGRQRKSATHTHTHTREKTDILNSTLYHRCYYYVRAARRGVFAVRRPPEITF